MRSDSIEFILKRIIKIALSYSNWNNLLRYHILKIFEIFDQLCSNVNIFSYHFNIYHSNNIIDLIKIIDTILKIYKILYKIVHLSQKYKNQQ